MGTAGINTKSRILADPALRYSRRRPSLPRSRPRSTIGPGRLNFRVRDGNGCGPPGRVTGELLSCKTKGLWQLNIDGQKRASYQKMDEFVNDQAARPISTGKLKLLLTLHIQPINVVV